MINTLKACCRRSLKREWLFATSKERYYQAIGFFLKVNVALGFTLK